MSNVPITIRPAEADDAPELARLIDLAGGGVYEFLLDGLAPGMTVPEMLAPGLASRTGSLSHRQSAVAEQDGHVVGVVHGYPVDWIRTEDYSGLPPTGSIIWRPSPPPMIGAAISCRRWRSIRPFAAGASPVGCSPPFTSGRDPSASTASPCMSGPTTTPRNGCTPAKGSSRPVGRRSPGIPACRTRAAASCCAARCDGGAYFTPFN